MGSNPTLSATPLRRRGSQSCRSTLFLERGFDQMVALRLTRLRQLYQDDLERGAIWDREV